MQWLIFVRQNIIKKKKNKLSGYKRENDSGDIQYVALSDLFSETTECYLDY